jgi:exodeoxyribonuclease-3
VAHQKARCKELARLSAITRLLAPERAWLDEVTGTMAADALREVSREGDQFSWWPDSEQAEHQPRLSSHYQPNSACAAASAARACRVSHASHTHR